MRYYDGMSFSELKDKKLVVYGCGTWGGVCAGELEKAGIGSFVFSDSNPQKWGSEYRRHKVISTEELRRADADAIVIIAIEKFEEPLNAVENMGIRRIALYMHHCLYRIGEASVLGETDCGSLSEKLAAHDVYLYGSGKYAEDFLYVFDWLDIKARLSDGSDIRLGENDIVICCDFDKDRAIETAVKLGAKAENCVLGEELFPLLDYRNRIVGKLPSVMMKQTLYSEMQEQPKCAHPFNRMQLSSNLSVHCCCGDWAESWGSLEFNSMEELWNSDVAKIFRLSIINRTYCFCNVMRCTRLKPNCPPASERISPPIPVKEIPDYIEIGIDKTCNLYCKSCRNSVCVETGVKHEKTKRVSEKILSSGWLERTKMLLLGGQGEVFFSPVYKSLMFGNNFRRHALDLRTNGTLITEQNLSQLTDIYDELHIIVSIDAAEKETYNKLRRSNSKNTWDDLMRNLALLSECRKQGKIQFFQINMCVQMENYREIPAFVEMGQKLGVDRVFITPIRNWGTYTDEEFAEIGILDENKAVKPEVAEAVAKIADASNVMIVF